MEEVIRKYVDECWGFVQEHREYLMYVPSYEEHIEPEMQDTFDNIIPKGNRLRYMSLNRNILIIWWTLLRKKTMYGKR